MACPIVFFEFVVLTMLQHRNIRAFRMTYPRGLRALCSYEVVPEQKARTTYDNILRLTDDPDVRDPIKFLREREIVHFQRFGEANRTNLSRFSVSKDTLKRYNIRNFFCKSNKKTECAGE